MDIKRPKTGGRKKNSANKTTAEIKNLLIHVLDANLHTIQKDLEEMSGKDRVAALLKISSLVMPKPVDTVIVEQVDKDSPFMKAMFPNRYL